EAGSQQPSIAGGNHLRTSVGVDATDRAERCAEVNSNGRGVGHLSARRISAAFFGCHLLVDLACGNNIAIKKTIGIPYILFSTLRIAGIKFEALHWVVRWNWTLLIRLTPTTSGSAFRLRSNRRIITGYLALLNLNLIAMSSRRRPTVRWHM